MRNRATTPLSKAKLRQSWSKYNLYNLSRLRQPAYRNRSFYQQKWDSKSVLRAYHGEPVREAHWNKMFRRRVKAVIPMDANYMARNDGTLESAGRGSGLDESNLTRRAKFAAKSKEMPYMQMTFAPLERRLDTAIFRALFASSTRQARQFVVHGAVKVNGKKMIYPGYLLNPGDLFQVEPERVMFATGAPKSSMGASPKPSSDADASEQPPAETESTSEPQSEAETQEDDIEDDRPPRAILKDLQSQARSILSHERTKIGAKKKQDLRAFTKAVKRMLSRSTNSTILTDSLEAQFQELKNQLRIQKENKKKGTTQSPSGQAMKKAQGQEGDKALAETQLASEEAREDAKDPITPDEEDSEVNYLSDEDLSQLERAFQSSVDNPIDPNKPYATPWRPRDYMSAFSFIPRYLEVNQNICAAVYLRHPVVRPGLAEVPTPYGSETGANAFVWYLRRR